MSLEELEICNERYKDILTKYGLKPDSMGYCSFTNNGNYPTAGAAIAISPYTVYSSISVYATDKGIVYYGWKQIKPPYNHLKKLYKEYLLSIKLYKKYQIDKKLNEIDQDFN